jgi:hypothetical protein
MRILKQIDELTQEEYSFYFCDGTILVLDTYRLSKKESKRKKNYTTIKWYNRLSLKDSTMTETEVPLTDEIKNEILQEFFKTISVTTWNKHKSI